MKFLRGETDAVYCSTDFCWDKNIGLWSRVVRYITQDGQQGCCTTTVVRLACCGEIPIKIKLLVEKHIILTKMLSIISLQLLVHV